MSTRTDLRGQAPTAAELRATLPRAEYDVDAALHHVRPVVEAVRDRGVEAVLEYTEKFDKVHPDTVHVPRAKLSEALAQLDPQKHNTQKKTNTQTHKEHTEQHHTDVTT